MLETTKESIIESFNKNDNNFQVKYCKVYCDYYGMGAYKTFLHYGNYPIAQKIRYFEDSTYSDAKESLFIDLYGYTNEESIIEQSIDLLNRLEGVNIELNKDDGLMYLNGKVWDGYYTKIY